MFLTGQKLNPLTAGWIAAIALLVVGTSVLFPQWMPYNVLALAGVAICVAWGVRGQPSALLWLWVLSFGMLDGYFWRLKLSGFFNLTIPRLLFAVVLLVFVIWMLSHRRMRADRGIFAAMLAFVIYIALRATASGWVNPPLEDQPYFKFLGALLFPFLAFWLMYNVLEDEKPFRIILILSSLYGLYALFISYCQIFDVRWLIWPSYINDPTVGIHFDRARGAFGETYPHVVFLVVLFYGNLFLLRRIAGPWKLVLWLEILAIPAALLFAQTRSGWLAFVIGGVIYLAYVSRAHLRGAKLATAAVVGAIALMLFWQNVSSADRRVGGWGSMGELRSRVLLVRQTMEMASEHPLVGIGWGKFLQAQRGMEIDPASYDYSIPGWRLPEHNAFLNVLAESGLIGLVLYVTIFVLLVRQSLQLWRKLPESGGFISRPLVGLFWIVLAVYLCDATFRDTLWEEFSNALFWSFSGLIVGLNRCLEPASLDVPVKLQLDAGR